MTILPATTSTLQAFDEDTWDDLFNYMEERRVIPTARVAASLK